MVTVHEGLSAGRSPSARAGERDHRRPGGADGRPRRAWSSARSATTCRVALVVSLASFALATRRGRRPGGPPHRDGQPLRRALRHGDRRRAAARAQHLRRPRPRAVGAGHRPGPLRLPRREGAPALVAGAGAAAAVVQGRRRTPGRRARGGRVGSAARPGRDRRALAGRPGPADRVVRPRGVGCCGGCAAAPRPALGDPADRAAGLPVVWAVLVAPDEIGALSPAAFARIPLEGLVLVGLVLLLPTRPAAWLATGAGLALGAAHRAQAPRPRRLGRLRPALRPARRPGLRRRRACRSCATRSARPTPTPSPSSPCC